MSFFYCSYTQSSCNSSSTTNSSLLCLMIFLKAALISHGGIVSCGFRVVKYEGSSSSSQDLDLRGTVLSARVQGSGLVCHGSAGLFCHGSLGLFGVGCTGDGSMGVESAGLGASRSSIQF